MMAGGCKFGVGSMALAGMDDAWAPPVHMLCVRRAGKAHVFSDSVSTA